MTREINQLKERVQKTIYDLKDDMVSMAKEIFVKAEIGYQEYDSSALLCEFLECNLFSVTRNVAGMDTAFIAEAGGGDEGPVIALLAEYDALPGLGHACAHNLIGTAAVGAAAGLNRFQSHYNGKIVVIGCPAEEAGIDGAGGKVRLIDAGIFNGVDAALIFHPMPKTLVGGETSALVGMEFEFKGKAAHGAGNPWDGLNALDGILSTFNSINALRQHVRDGVRIHGIITNGGDAPNIVPEYAAARFFVRYSEDQYLKEIVEKVENCARGAALATGTSLTINRFNHFYSAMNSNRCLAKTYEKNLERVGLHVEGVKKGKGSTDFGNVSKVVPACELAIRLGRGIVPHTREFLQAANSEAGFEVMIQGANVMAMSAIDLILDSNLLNEVKAEFHTGQQ